MKIWNEHLTDSRVTAWGQLMNSKLLRYIIGPGAVSTPIAYLSLGKNWWNLAIWESVLLSTGFFLALSFCLFSWYFIKLVRRKHPNGEYLVLLKKITSEIHRWKMDGTISKPDIVNIGSFVCNELKNAFDYKVKESDACSVCIKVPVGDTHHIDAETLVKNLCRNNGECQQRDTQTYINAKHNIFGNSSFSTIFGAFQSGLRDRLFYINNDVPGDLNYLTSSSGHYPKAISYKSELVVPIIPILHDNQVTIPQPLGFLCVDCGKKHVFDKGYDLVVLQCIADSLYGIIMYEKTLNS